MAALPPPGSLLPLTAQSLADGFKGYVFKVVMPGYLRPVMVKVTGQLTDDGEIQVMVMPDGDA